MRLRFLGTGTSHGVPVIGCSCRVCSSDDPRDTRYRSSVFVEGDGGEAILVDAGPEFRLQALRARLTRLDALLVTHAHADHVHGLDDVRPLTRGKPLPVYASRSDAEELRHRFSYAFGHGQEGGGKPRLELSEIDDGATVGGVRVVAVPLLHGQRPILGYRLGGFAYLTDCSAVPDSSRRLLGGLDLLVVDALRLRPHPTHFSVDEALALARELRPGRLLLTHICHDLTHVELESYCDAAGLPFPAGPAYDGLEAEIPAKRQ
ncbi:MAG: MBL fold metallo-hydrolase [Spirochaetae bacterium HGW-Spirochaetae-3]|nr:MAG: MBL fold metallo-hydrolase [Spirochaetae bacterium HGW-Spirochaetae-3]